LGRRLHEGEAGEEQGEPEDARGRDGLLHGEVGEGAVEGVAEEAGEPGIERGLDGASCARGTGH